MCMVMLPALRLDVCVYGDVADTETVDVCVCGDVAHTEAVDVCVW